MSEIDYSIVVPVYKSTATLKQLCDEVNAVFSESNLTYELILVNDASPDDTWNIVKEIKANSSTKVTAVNLAKNTGQHHALLCGFQYVTGKFAITIDDDLQFSPKDILLLIKQQKLTDADLVYGIQFVKEHSVFRNLGSRTVAYMFSSFASTPGRGSSFRLISSNIIQQIKNFNHRYIFLDELLAWFTSNTQFIEVTHSKRKDGLYIGQVNSLDLTDNFRLHHIAFTNYDLFRIDCIFDLLRDGKLFHLPKSKCWCRAWFHSSDNFYFYEHRFNSLLSWHNWRIP
jgi:glycosyltransferase involved in cell wall biosynthesis